MKRTKFIHEKGKKWHNTINLLQERSTELNSILYKYHVQPVTPDVLIELDITVTYTIDGNSICRVSNSANEAVANFSYQHQPGRNISHKKHVTGTT